METELTSILDEVAPLKTGHQNGPRKTKHRLSRKAVDAKKQRRRLEWRWKASNTEPDRLAYRAACSSASKLVTTSFAAANLQRINEASKNPKRLWTTIKFLLHGLNGPALWNVTQATLISKLIYASPSWFGFLDESSKTRCQGMIKKLIRTGYLGEGFASFAELCEHADDDWFRNMQTNNHHVLHQLLPPIKNSQHALRPRVHPYQIPSAKNNALGNNYIYRMLHKDIY